MVKIETATAAHAESFHRCLDAVARERKYLAMVEAPPLPAVKGFVDVVIAMGSIQLMAMDGDAVVGWCDVQSRPLEGLKHVGTLGMGVLASHRRQGIGRALVTEALARARTAGLERVELEVFASNTAAIALYDRLGFAREGVKRRARKIDGSYDDIVVMAIVW